MIELINVNKYFYKNQARQVHALDNINLTINKQDFTVITGSSGCGKSTLLNAIGSLDPIDDGNMLFMGSDITNYSDVERTELRLNKIGFIFQSYNLIPVLNVAENIGFIMDTLDTPQKQITERVNYLADYLGIYHKLSSLPNQLSGGEQQRVAVARAVASMPSLILADEPTANLDSTNSSQLLDLMAKLNKEEQTTIVFASHDGKLVERAEKVIRMNDGKIIY